MALAATTARWSRKQLASYESTIMSNMRYCDGAGADRNPLAPVQSVRHLSASILATKRPGRPSNFNGSSVAGRVALASG